MRKIDVLFILIMMMGVFSLTDAVKNMINKIRKI